MSEVSSDNLPSSSDDESRRAQKNVAELPYNLQGPGVPPRQLPSLDEFWQAHPRERSVELPEAELLERIEWSRQAGAALELYLAELRKMHMAEWRAKEELLDRLLVVALGPTSLAGGDADSTKSTTITNNN